MLSKIKLVISEIDGIITDGSIPIDELGYTPFKNYCLKDFEAINKIKNMFKFIFISNNSSVNYNLCRKKNIPFFHSANKKQTIIKVINKYNFTFDNVIYIGHTFSDIDCINLSSLSLCPSNAVEEIKERVDIILPVRSGDGVLCELYSFLFKKWKNII